MGKTPFDGISRRLTSVRNRLRRRDTVREQLATARKHLRKARARLRKLGGKLQACQADLARWRERTTRNLLYSLLGKRDDRIREASRGAVSAVHQYDGCQEEVAALELEVQDLKEELQQLKELKPEYESLLKRKGEMIRTSGRPEAAVLVKVVERTSEAETAIRDIRKALASGKGSLSSLEVVVRELDRAHRAVLSGPTRTARNRATRSTRLAAAAARRVQTRLDRFQQDLARAASSARLRTGTETLKRYGRVIRSLLRPARPGRGTVETAQERTRTLRGRVSSILSRLEARLDQYERRLRALEKRRRRLILRA